MNNHRQSHRNDKSNSNSSWNGVFDNNLESVLESVIEKGPLLHKNPFPFNKKDSGLQNNQKKKKLIKPNSFSKAAIGSFFEKEVEDFDHKMVSCLVRRFEKATAKKVAVNYKKQQPSEFVVSLKEYVVLPDEQEDRVSVAEQIKVNEVLSKQKKELSVTDISTKTLRTNFNPLKVNSDSKHKKIRSKKNYWLLKFKHYQNYWWSLWQREEKKIVQTEQKVVQEVENFVEDDLPEAIHEVQVNPPIKQKSFARALVSFLLFAFVMTLPAQALVVYQHLDSQGRVVKDKSVQAVQSLLESTDSRDLNLITQGLSQASSQFKTAQESLNESSLLVISAGTLLPSKYQSARILLNVGDKVSKAGQILTLGLSKALSDQGQGIIPRLETLHRYTQSAIPLLQESETSLKKLDINEVPPEYQEQIAQLPQKLKKTRMLIQEISDLSALAPILLGRDDLRRYLLVFQNNSELRPSGGFIGSMAEVVVDQGQIKDIRIPLGGSYDLQGYLTKRVQSPEPLHLINPLWQFQDSNWFADFPKTAQKIRWFWLKSGESTLDGVIAINATFMFRILDITGPIKMPQYNKVITKDNFLFETQKAVEIDYDKKKNTPKKFIADLFEEIKNRAQSFSTQDWIKVFNAFNEATQDKEIQIAMFNPKEESQIQDFGWGGEFKKTNGDFLAIIGANIAGQKTDLDIKEKVKYTVNIDKDGYITNRIVLHREHVAKKGELFKGVRNVEYFRFYVPLNSELINVQGFKKPSEKLFKKPIVNDDLDPDLAKIKESTQKKLNINISREDNYTVFGGWAQLDPGQSQDIILTYKLPFTIYDIVDKNIQSNNFNNQNNTKHGAYTLFLSSQSGKERKIDLKINTDPSLKIIWSNQKEIEQNLSWQGVWSTNKVFAELIGLKNNKTQHD